MLAEAKKPAFYREWLDSYFARDIQRLFGFRDMNRFNALFEYMLKQSGGQLEVSRTATALGITRPTVESHLRALETTHAVTLLRPFHGGGGGEITRMAKLYAFDTGFVSFARGWNPLRPEDLGILWEHMVLEYLQAHQADTPAMYWRDKAGHEVDFVLQTQRDEVDAIECKWDPAAFDVASLKAFRALHPGGRNFLVCPGADPSYVRCYGDIEITVGTPVILKRLAR
jgi:predicted AAA+ superfamily ATPase